MNIYESGKYKPHTCMLLNHSEKELQHLNNVHVL